MATTPRLRAVTFQLLGALAAAAATYAGLGALGGYGPALAPQAGPWAVMLAGGLTLGRLLGRFGPAWLPLLLGGLPCTVLAPLSAAGPGSLLAIVALALSWHAAAATGAAAGSALARVRRRLD